jgi:hypothetical protein
MILNILSGRTYKDLGQYPVFPWILNEIKPNNDRKEDYEPKELIEWRDLEKPVGALLPERVENVKTQFENGKLIGGEPFHYGSHYSNPVAVTYFLLRIHPFAEIAKKLQGGKFDLGDRLFRNWDWTWNLSMSYDSKELIPEVFYLGEIFVNANDYRFGSTQDKKQVKKAKKLHFNLYMYFHMKNIYKYR